MGMSSAAESLPSVPALHLVSAVLPEQMSASVAQGIPLRLDRHMHHLSLIISASR